MIADLANWVTPFTFVSGVGLLILSTVNRFHNVNNLIRNYKSEKRGDHKFKMLLRRSRCFHRALTGLYVSLAMFALAAFVSVSGFTIFSMLGISEIDGTPLSQSLFIVSSVLSTFGVLAIVYSAGMLMKESSLSWDLIKTYSDEEW